MTPPLDKVRCSIHLNFGDRQLRDTRGDELQGLPGGIYLPREYEPSAVRRDAVRCPERGERSGPAGPDQVEHKEDHKRENKKKEARERERKVPAKSFPRQRSGGGGRTPRKMDKEAKRKKKQGKISEAYHVRQKPP